MSCTIAEARLSQHPPVAEAYLCCALGASSLACVLVPPLLGILTGAGNMIVRSLSVTCVAARRAFLVLLALVVLVAFGASGREWTSCGLGVLELWPSVGCLSPSLTYRFY